MAQPYGRWREPTIDGPRRILVDQVSFQIPRDAEVRIVDGAAGGYAFAHVRTGGRVYVLCRLGQLWESDEDARHRAVPLRWTEIAGR